MRKKITRCGQCGKSDAGMETKEYGTKFLNLFSAWSLCLM